MKAETSYHFNKIHLFQYTTIHFTFISNCDTLNYNYSLSSWAKDEPSIDLICVLDFFGGMLENNNSPPLYYNQKKGSFNQQLGH